MVTRLLLLQAGGLEMLLFPEVEAGGPREDYLSGDTTPCRMTGVTLHSRARYKEI